jgi:hypothetical protein
MLYYFKKNNIVVQIFNDLLLIFSCVYLKEIKKNNDLRIRLDDLIFIISNFI